MNIGNPEFLDTATQIGAAICRDAMWCGDRCNWLGDQQLTHGRRSVIQHAALGPDLYGGTMGIALFLAELSTATKDALFARTALAAARQSLSVFERILPPRQPGLYSGRAGVAHGLVRAGEVLQHDEFLSQGLGLFDQLAEAAPEVDGTDVISGKAGIISAIAGIEKRHPCPKRLAWALRLGTSLLEAAIQDGDGWSWATANRPGEPRRHGFAHGSAGIASALGELYEITGEQRFAEGARGAAKFAAGRLKTFGGGSTEDSKSGAGADPRFSERAVGWCHGPAGICEALRRLHEVLGNEWLKQEAEIALEILAEHLRGFLATGRGNFCLCHGIAGNAEPLTVASSLLGRTDLVELAAEVGRKGNSLYGGGRLPWPCGFTSEGFTPGLMLGLAGIGRFYLRLGQNGEGTIR